MEKELARSFHHNPGDIWFDTNLVSRDQYALKANWLVPLITLNAANCLKPNYAGYACLYKSFPVSFCRFKGWLSKAVLCSCKDVFLML